MIGDNFIDTITVKIDNVVIKEINKIMIKVFILGDKELNNKKGKVKNMIY